MTDHRDVAVEVTIAAPTGTVWRALRERDDLRRWHGWEDPTLDEEIEVIYFSEAREHLLELALHLDLLAEAEER